MTPRFLVWETQKMALSLRRLVRQPKEWVSVRDEDIRSLVLDKFKNLLDNQEKTSNRQLDTRIWNSGGESQAVDKI